MEIASFEQLTHIANNKPKKKVAIVASNDTSIINSALKAKKQGLIVPVFIGKKKFILEVTNKVDADIEIIDLADHNEAAQKAVDLWLDDQVDLIMKGLIPTSVLLHYVLKKRKSLLQSSILSHMALFQIPTYYKCIALSDAAINISPNIDHRIALIKNSVHALQRLGIESPNVALLSAIEKINSKITSTTESEIIKNRLVSEGIDWNIEGPLSLDIAISAKASQTKKYASKVSGNTDLMVVPEIVSGNILYKSLGYFANAQLAAVVLGAKSPIILTSRADNEESKFYSIVLGIALV